VSRRLRLQLFIRVVAFCAIGVIGLSFGMILVAQRVGPHAFAYLVGLQRWSIRLLAYQASLVDEYPPFSLSELASLPVATARVTP